MYTNIQLKAICLYCGQPNLDSALECRKCGAPMVGNAELLEEKPRPIISEGDDVSQFEARMTSDKRWIKQELDYQLPAYGNNFRFDIPKIGIMTRLLMQTPSETLEQWRISLRANEAVPLLERTITWSKHAPFEIRRVIDTLPIHLRLEGQGPPSAGSLDNFTFFLTRYIPLW